MEQARHVFRALLVLVVVIAAVSLGRGFLVPKSYGLHGSYRYDNVPEQMAVRAPRHAGAASCAGCHAPQAEKRAAGSHRTVSCEVCHAPLSAHVADGKRTAQFEHTVLVTDDGVDVLTGGDGAVSPVAPWNR